MRILAVGGLLILFASCLFAQRIGTTQGTAAGYGNVVFPAGRPSITTPFTQTNTFPNVPVIVARPVVNGSVRGNGFVNGAGNGFGRRNNNNNGNSVVYVPFAYPVFGGGGYYGGYYSGYGDPSGGMAGGMPPQPQQPNGTILYPPQMGSMMMMGPPPQMGGAPLQAPLPNGYMPQEPGASGPDSAQAQTEAPYYLLAFKDHSIYSAVGYWVDGDTLHYITNGNVHNQASLSLVDRDLTVQLNKGHGVQVNLPPPVSR
jgi:hypothetical protein